MGRAILKTLKESTLLTFFRICKDWGLKAGEDYKYNYRKAVFGYSLPFGVLGGIAGISHLATDNNYLANIATIISGLYLYLITGPAYVEEMTDILRDLRQSKKVVDNYRRQINKH